MEIWSSYFRLIQEKDFFKTNNQNIDKGIFQRDSFSPHLFSMTLIPLSS